VLKVKILVVVLSLLFLNQCASRPRLGATVGSILLGNEAVAGAQLFCDESRFRTLSSAEVSDLFQEELSRFGINELTGVSARRGDETIVVLVVKGRSPAGASTTLTVEIPREGPRLCPFGLSVMRVRSD
jgi:hypothetical protein